MRRFPAWALLFAFPFAAVATSVAAPDQEPAAGAAKRPSPIAQVTAIVDALRANDMEALAEAVSEDSTEELAREWEESRAKAAEREHPLVLDVESERLWSQLANAQGKAALLAELQPKLAKEADDAVIQFNLGLAGTLAAITAEKEYTAEQAKQFSQLVLAAQRWANDMDWSDSARLSRALDAAQRLVQSSDLATPRELELLPYEDALALGDDAIATVKEILRAYDLDVDATLASVRAEVILEIGDRALVRYDARVLDVPLTVMQDLRYYNGRWMEAASADYWEQMERESAAEGVDAAAAAAAPDASVSVEFAAPPPPPSRGKSDSASCKPSAQDTPAPWAAAPLN